MQLRTLKKTLLAITLTVLYHASVENSLCHSIPHIAKHIRIPSRYQSAIHHDIRLFSNYSTARTMFILTSRPASNYSIARTLFILTSRPASNYSTTHTLFIPRSSSSRHVHIVYVKITHRIVPRCVPVSNISNR
ncbi:hypothetical protein BJ138DRAFT_152579 [Hygrophoropsis aurantiaca]|uniref:Uncharacterized protein n=1 Tax=Hygrophoropsis aurantiaca TaxID=72124 RepID=A0ACB8AAL8_9AGAM|nr:hypothetical protein BJ138DRAFT_152579 [Hygrophoropsis aurantiaca]